jgi:hypothetical protein
MSENLRECPHCGGVASVVTKHKRAGIINYIICMKCGIRTPPSTTAEIPREKWNTRHDPPHETVEKNLYEAIDCDYGNPDKSKLYKIDLKNGLSTDAIKALEEWYVHHGKPEEV